MSRANEPADQQSDQDVSSAAAQPADAPENVVDLAAETVDLGQVEQLNQEALEAEIAALKDQLLRAHAEMDNVRRRAQDDVAKARKFGIESFAESLVPVKDSLEAALAQTEQSLDTLREGVEVTLRQLTGAFERNHLKVIDPAVGDKFDPNLHQAISSVPADVPANTVAQTLQKGYLIAERVLRPALVMVSAG